MSPISPPALFYHTFLGLSIIKSDEFWDQFWGFHLRPLYRRRR